MRRACLIMLLSLLCADNVARASTIEQDFPTEGTFHWGPFRVRPFRSERYSPSLEAVRRCSWLRNSGTEDRFVREGGSRVALRVPTLRPRRRAAGVPVCAPEDCEAVLGGDCHAVADVGLLDCCAMNADQPGALVVDFLGRGGPERVA